MKRFVRAAAIVVAVALLLPSAPALAQNLGSIRGVVDDDSGVPVAGASVSVSGPIRETATTDARGAFALTSLPSGAYDIVVSKGGYQTATDSDATVGPGGSTVLAVTLHAASFS